VWADALQVFGLHDNADITKDLQVCVCMCAYAYVYVYVRGVQVGGRRTSRACRSLVVWEACVSTACVWLDWRLLCVDM
jgi:hypothetical protein